MNQYAVALNAILSALIQLQQASARVLLRQAEGEPLTVADLQAIRASNDEAMAGLDAAIERAEAEGR